MKQTDIDKLYKNLTPQERAKMAFEALCFGDGDTANKITNSVPRYTYKSVDLDYRKPLEEYFQVAFLWSVEYWKCYSKMLSVIGLQASFPVSSEGKSDIEKKAELNKLSVMHDVWEQRLIALGLILKALEKSHGIGINTLPHLADAHTVYGLEFEPEHLESDALEYYEMYLAMFICLIDGKEVSPELDAYFNQGVQSVALQ